MAQYIDKDAVVAEIKRLISIANSQYDLVGNEDIRNRILWSQQASVCSQILSFLDTLEVQEVQEDPVSDELLEKAAVEAFKQIVDLDKNSFFEIFKAGAQWQKQHLMKDAVDGSVCAQRPNGEVIVRTNFIRAGLALMEKVKLIIIKK